MVGDLEHVIGAAKRYLAAIEARGATNTRAQWSEATFAVEAARVQLQETVLDLGAVIALAHLDD